MNPEYKYDLLSKIKYLVHFFSKQAKTFADLRIECLRSLEVAVNDCSSFFNMSHDEFWDSVDTWEKMERGLFENAPTVLDFYQQWRGVAARKNVCANIVNQMLDPRLYSICAYYAERADSAADFGCGTGTLSLSLLLNGHVGGDLLLLDVPNDVRRFIDFRCDRHNLNRVSFENVLDFTPRDKQVDLVICIDVLEHLENSSEVFCENIFPLLRTGGFLILRAPWRGQLTHIDGAADNFYAEGGRRFLARNFQEVFRFGSKDISCVYRKVS